MRLADDPRAVDIPLRDGRSVRVRPIRRDDERPLLAFLESMDPGDRYLRFFSGGVNLAAVAERGWPSTAASVTGSSPSPRTTAPSSATAVRCAARPAPRRPRSRSRSTSALHGEGIATTMLAHLAQAARRRRDRSGFVARRAAAQPPRCSTSSARAASPRTVRAEPDELHVRDADGAERRGARGASTSATAIAAVGRRRPRPAPALGRGRRRVATGPARSAARCCATSSPPASRAACTPSTRRAGESPGITAVAAWTRSPAELELAVIAIPAASVVARRPRLRGARRARARRASPPASRRRAPTGAARQHELLRDLPRGGMRLVGPNCLGVINTDPGRAPRTRASPRAARRPAASRSCRRAARSGIAVVDAARERGLGLSSFVSVGNKADLSGNDFLAFWEQDERTASILLYLESFGNPRKFARVARRVARRKPIVAVKGGRSAAGRARRRLAHRRAAGRLGRDGRRALRAGRACIRDRHARRAVRRRGAARRPAAAGRPPRRRS